MLLLLSKDLRQAWRTFRLPALVLTGVFFALLEPLTAKFMPEILAYMAKELEGLAEILPQMGPLEALTSFCGDLTQIGALVLIAIAMGAVALERERGIAAWVLTRPISRSAYFWSKYLALLIGVAVTLIVSGALALAYTATLFGPFPVGGALWGLLFIGIFLMLILAVTVTASSLLRSQLAAGGVGIAFLFIIFVPQLLLGGTAVVRYFPHTLAGHLSGLLSGMLEWTYFLPAALITAALANLLVAAGAFFFQKAEL
ncbi:MAG: ABC transporter permease subunit [Bacillota bacterium]